MIIRAALRGGRRRFIDILETVRATGVRAEPMSPGAVQTYKLAVRLSIAILDPIDGVTEVPQTGLFGTDFRHAVEFSRTDAHRPGSLDPSRGNRATLCQHAAVSKQIRACPHAAPRPPGNRLHPELGVPRAARFGSRASCRARATRRATDRPRSGRHSASVTAWRCSGTPHLGPPCAARRTCSSTGRLATSRSTTFGVCAAHLRASRPRASAAAQRRRVEVARARPGRTAPRSPRCACGLRGAVHQSRDLLGQPRGRRPRLPAAPRSPGRAPRSPLAARNGEVAQVAPDVGVVDVDPVLVERVRRGQRGVEPEAAAAGGLAELRPVDESVTSGTVSACAGSRSTAADQVEAGGDVAPLVAAADLQPAAVVGDRARGSRRTAAACS